MEYRFTHSPVIRMFIPRVLQKLIGCLSTSFYWRLISLMNETKALILLGHLAQVVWITRSGAVTMATVSDRRLDRG